MRGGPSLLPATWAKRSIAASAVTGHPVAASFEPGENWFWDYEREEMMNGLELAPPRAHPEGQPVPGPAGRVPRNWRNLLHE